jgi:hypothetical protein
MNPPSERSGAKQQKASFLTWVYAPEPAHPENTEFEASSTMINYAKIFTKKSFRDSPKFRNEPFHAKI